VNTRASLRVPEKRHIRTEWGAEVYYRGGMMGLILGLGGNSVVGNGAPSEKEGRLLRRSGEGRSFSLVPELAGAESLGSMDTSSKN